MTISDYLFLHLYDTNHFKKLQITFESQRSKSTELPSDELELFPNIHEKINPNSNHGERTSTFLLT